MVLRNGVEVEATSAAEIAVLEPRHPIEGRFGAMC
jgi:hypothetical protein